MTKTKPDKKQKGTLSDSRFGLFILLTVAVFILYGNTIRNNYCFDDDFVTGKNATVIHKGLSAIPDIFSSRYAEGKDLVFGYRPVPKSTFALEYSLFGLNPHVSHLINILLYLFTGLLLYTILRKLFFATGKPFIVMVVLLFLAHPVHTEVVASLKNREELLYFLFCLLALRFFLYLADRGNWRHFLYGTLFFMLAMLSKQSAIIFAIIIPFSMWFSFYQRNSPSRKDWIKILLTFFTLTGVGLLVYFLPDQWLLPENVKLYSFENPLHFIGSSWIKYATGFYALLFYLKLLVFPHPLVYYYGFNMLDAKSWSDPYVIFSFILHAGLLIYAFFLIVKKNLTGFALLFYFLAIALFSNLYTPVNGIVGERFLYAPSLGFILILVYLIFKISKTEPRLPVFDWKQKPVLWMVFVTVFVLYAGKTISRNGDWKDNYTLFSHDIAYLKSSVKANDLMASELLDSVYRDLGRTRNYSLYNPQVNEVLKYYNQSLSLYPENAKALNNIAGIYMNFRRQPEIALQYFEKAAKIEKENDRVMVNMGQCYEYMKNYNKAVGSYREALKINPDIPDVYVYIGNIYAASGKLDSAIAVNKELIVIHPELEAPWANAGYYSLQKGDTANAVHFMDKAFRINPVSYDKGIILYKYFMKTGDSLNARWYYNQLRQLKASQPGQ
jgi:protein O-mannosyl-transferase